MARIPDPVPTSKALNLVARTKGATRSMYSMQPRVVACVPVPNAIPGSMVITCRRYKVGGVAQGGVTQKALPIFWGRKNLCQELFQFRSLRIFHCRRGVSASGWISLIPRRKDRTSFLMELYSPELAK